MQAHRLDVLDGLRGIAIALVVWFHLWQVSWLDPYGLVFIPVSGFLGVELFFFLSAFCLSYPIPSLCGLGIALARAAPITFAVERPLLRLDPSTLSPKGRPAAARMSRV